MPKDKEKENGSSTANRCSPAAQQILLFGEILSTGGGTFLVKATRPVEEVSTKEAARMIGMSPSYLNQLIDEGHPSVKLLVWRWISPKQGKRMIEVASIHRYREAGKNPEFGQASGAGPITA